MYVMYSTTTVLRDMLQVRKRQVHIVLYVCIHYNTYMGMHTCICTVRTHILYIHVYQTCAHMCVYTLKVCIQTNVGSTLQHI